MALIIWTEAPEQVLKAVWGPALTGTPTDYTIYKSVTNGIPQPKPGDVILACGGKVLKVIQDAGLLPKNRTITSLREKPLPYQGAWLLVTFDPRITTREYERLPDCQWDMQLALRLLHTGSTKAPIGEYRWVESFHEVIDEIDAQYEETGKPVEVACDLETKSLNPYNPEAWIISISFTVKEGYSQVMYFEKGENPEEPLPWESMEVMGYWQALWTQINWILTTEKVTIRGANFKYDSSWLVPKWGITCTNFKFDTMLVGSLLNENRSNSLKLHAKIMTPMGGYEAGMDKYDFGSLELVPKPKLLVYAGGDTDATYRVAKVMKKELVSDKQLVNLYTKLVHPASKVFERVERVGVCIDLPYYRQLEVDLNKEVRRLQHEMVGCMPRKMQIKYSGHIDAAFSSGKSPFTPKILKEFLFSPAGMNLKPKVLTAKTKEPSTSMDHLMMFGDNPDAANFIDLFKNMGSASKTLSTFVVGFLKHLREDGRLHPTYLLHRGDYGAKQEDGGTTTGRTSCKDPAMQTLPKHSSWAKILRMAYIAPPGMELLQCDYSQGELRVTAVVAEEPTMIAAYQNNADLHAITAARLNHYSMDDFLLLPEAVRDELRSGGKAGNFGLIYGMMPKGYKEYAYTTYGVKLTEDEAYTQREAFFDLYDRLPAWHEEYKAMAHRWGMVRSPLGRIRHLPLIDSPDWDKSSQAERQAINSPIQSCLSDMMQLAMVYIDRIYGDQVQMCMMTHDSVAMYIPEGTSAEWAPKIREVMESLPLKKDFGWDSPLTFVADAEAGPNLAELKKIK